MGGVRPGAYADDVIDQRRGVLYPERLPDFRRVPAPERVRDLVSWFWIPQWELPDGVVSRQELVAYPALNLVVQPEAVTLSGATTRASSRELRGRGWAVGALLRPEAVAALIEDPAAIRDAEHEFPAPELHGPVAEAMADADIAAAVAAFADWLSARVGEVSASARLAGAMADLLMTDRTVLRAEDAAVRLAVSMRTLQRLAHRHVGIPPLAMIRRRRLQEAAQRLRDDPQTELAMLAAELGYADHAHLAGDFRAVLGISPSTYRSLASG